MRLLLDLLPQLPFRIIRLSTWCKLTFKGEKSQLKKPVSQQPNARPQEIRKRVQNPCNISKEKKQ